MTDQTTITWYMETFLTTVLVDALLSATPSYWSRRADELAAVGTATADEAATACRNAATFWRTYGSELLDAEETVFDVIREVLGGASS